MFWKQTEKTASAAAPKRSFILRWGNILLLLFMIVLTFFITATTDPETKQATLASFFGTIFFFLSSLGMMVLSIVRFAKKYHRARSFIWILMTPILTFLLFLSFIPAPTTESTIPDAQTQGAEFLLQK